MADINADDLRVAKSARFRPGEFVKELLGGWFGFRSDDKNEARLSKSHT